MTDEQILAAYLKRDEQAICESNAKYGSYCLAIAQRILQNQEDAKECVNDTWLRAWRAIPPERPANLKLFLAKITRNLSLNQYQAKTAQKRGGGEVPLILEELASCLGDPDGAESAYMAKELGGAINRFAHALPERECNLFLRRYFYSEPIAKIAARYGITSHHASVILSRVRKKLKDYLKMEGLV